MPGLLKQTLNPTLYRYLVQIYKETIAGFNNKSYSQEGEDMILRRIFEHQQKGFYIDVGAHHPKRFSNTYYFYRRGWKGINIDCSPGSMDLFKTKRKNDINLECAISDKFEQLKLHTYNEPAINTFVPDLWSGQTTNYVLMKTIEMETVTLEYVLSQYLKKDKTIDFLSIDVEGMDINVLRSNNWELFRPKIVLVEDVSSNEEFISGSKITQFMNSQAYVLYAKTVNTLIFRERFFYPFGN